MKAGEVRQALRSLGVRPSRSMGQNFLLDEAQAQRQAQAADLSPGDAVLEIGPGLGILTAALAARGPRVVAIERDRRLAARLGTLGARVEVVVGDALEIPWPPFDWCVSNLPFSISSLLLFRLLDCRFKGAVLMVQREFARRLVAPVGTADYSRLTVKAHHRAVTTMLWTVPPSAFWPQPRVSAAVVKLVPRPAPFEPADEAAFLRLVDVLFQHRRKTIRTILSLRARQLGLPSGWEARVPPEVLRARPQDLVPADLARLSDILIPPQP